MTTEHLKSGHIMQTILKLTIIFSIKRCGNSTSFIVWGM
ncbi:MAG: hypothetical protein JWR61_4643 [Ferruginibacter sp.]|nr:hypothetical protein [Ferruginibacter sp.]